MNTAELKTKSKRTDESLQSTGAEAVIQSLRAEGVKTIFGYPGGAIMPIYDALFHHLETVNHILTRHEQGAIHAAQGYARTSGKTGVVFATSGPGATNLITGLADALIDSTPLVCITGQVASHLLGTDAFQETDVMGISMPVTKWNCQVTHAADIAPTLAKAFYIASSGRPGPVLVDITKDAQFEILDFSYEKCTSVRSYQPKPKLNVDQVQAAANLLNKAKKTFDDCRTRNYAFQCRRRTVGFYQENGYSGSFYTFGIRSLSKSSPFICRNGRDAWQLCPQYKNQ